MRHWLLIICAVLVIATAIICLVYTASFPPPCSPGTKPVGLTNAQWIVAKSNICQ